MNNSKLSNETIKFYDELLTGVETDNLPVRDVYENEEGENWLEKEFALSKKLGDEITEKAYFVTAFSYLLCKFNMMKNIIVNDFDLKGNRISPFVFSYDDNDAIKEKLVKSKSYLEDISKNDISLSELVKKYDINNEIDFMYLTDNKSSVNTITLNSLCSGDNEGVSSPKILFELFKVEETKFKIKLGIRDDMFSEGFSESFLNAFVKIAEEFAVKEKFADVDLLYEEDIKKLDSFFGAKLSYDRNDTIVSMINEQIKSHPNKIAVSFGGKNFTYTEFNKITNKFANYLIKENITKDDVVGVMIGRNEYMPILAFSASKTGATYMPLDPGYPDDRLSFMLGDAGAKFLITTKSLISKVSSTFKGNILLIDDESDMKKVSDETDVHVDIAPSDRFIMLYTSGTTGTPKGVELLHSNIAAIIHHIDWTRRNDGDMRVAAYASFGFDANMYEMYPPLTTGGTLFIIPDEIRLDLFAIREYYQKNNITHGFMTTQMGRQFVELDGLNTLKEFTVGGEKLASVKPPKFRFVNAYGPTETSVYVTQYIVDKLLKDIPIGKPTSNSWVYVLDEKGKRLPIGASGELLISGPQVARGYLNRPDKNAEAFVKNPYCDKAPYDRAYKSGDVVRFLPDGNIQYIGRHDMQVKVRGFRIELSEVEDVIRRCSGIKDCTVVAYDDSAGMKYLVAYVVSDSKVDAKKVNDFILKEKPVYMVPSVIMQIDKIPLTQNQKVNKRALPKPEAKVDESYKKPENKRQEKIFDLVASVIGNKNFGVDTDLFMAGLNSISVVRLNVLLGKEFNVPIRMNDISENSTVIKLDEFLSKNDVEQIDYSVKLERYPISKTQSGIFVECIANPTATIYNLPILIKMSEEIDVNRLKSAIEKVVEAHPYIKATIHMDDATGEIYAKRNDNASIDVGITKTEKMVNSETLIKPFAVIGKKLYRFMIFDTAKDGKYLFMDLHHIIFDGTSLVILMNDIDKAYRGEKIDAETFDGFAYALNEEKLLKTDSLKNAKEYYDNLLKGVDAESLLPKDDTGITECDLVASKVTRRINIDRHAVEDFCSKNNISANSFFNAVFGFVLSKYDYKEELAYTTVYSGRNDSRVYNVICMLVKTLPVVCHYDKDTKIKDYLTSYSKQIFDSMSNDLYAFSDIKNDYKISADVLFIYQGDNFVFDKFCGKSCKTYLLDSKYAMEPFKIELNVENGEYVAHADFRKDFFFDTTADGFIECMEAVAKEFMQKEKLSEVSLLTARTKNLIDKFNETYIPVENISTDKAFEKAVEKYKDRVAIIGKDETITYDELNKRANRLAHSLIDLGVKPDDFVGFMTDRCANAYVGRIGIWKSGGAFLAIDPKYPDDRISYILEDSKAKLLVTKEEIYEKKKDLFAKLGVKVLLMNDMLKNTNDSNPNVDIKPHNLAYCLYTSGSTGKPKGVMVEHAGVVNLATDSEKSVQVQVFTKDCKVLGSVTALTFDVSVGEHVIALHNGLSIAIASEEEITNPLLLCDMIIKNKVDGFTCTPSYINNMLDIVETYPALRQIKGFQVGAETFPKQLYRKMRENGINARITNSYGPTEATDYTTTNFVENDKHITIGKPLPNYQVYMFDKFDNILPPMVLGELVIGGIGVARGYVGREDLNTTKFIKTADNRLYKSGDLAKWNYEGNIDFLGRMDNQVKLHGLRIELDEISNVINKYGDIKQSISVVKTNSEGEEYLAAYFIASSKVDIEKLYAFIRKSLTEYMVPAMIMQLDAFPTNVNGKVDKHALPDASQEVVKKEVKAASSDLQNTILDMFKLALNRKDVGVDEDFFKLGGTSLSASKIAMKAMTLKLPITYSDIFDYPTVLSLEQLVLSKQKGEETQSVAKDEKAAVKEPQNANSADDEVIKKALSHNVIDEVSDICSTEYKDVLLTGATGFLGIHVLKYMIDNTDKKIYCFMRQGKMSSLMAKLKHYLMYYFDDSMDELFGKRLFLIAGDITEKEKVSFLKNYDFDVVINCAACVKHFGADDTLMNVNVNGVKNLIDLCVENNKKLIQVSTASVAGSTYEGSDIENAVLYENVLNIGQDISNKYVHTKFLAEDAILRAIEEKGLKAKIIRVGNLMSRYSDGEFQINSIENAFMKQLKAFYKLKSFPISRMDEQVEFSPIDCVAETIVRLSETNDKFTVFLSCNNHYVQMGDVIYAMNRLGSEIAVVDDKDFDDRLMKLMSDDKKNDAVSVLISYNSSGNRKTIEIPYNCQYTTKALYRINYKWPIVDEDYIEKSLQALMSLGYFDE